VVVLVEEKPAGEDQEMENMDCFVETIHMAYRKFEVLPLLLGSYVGVGGGLTLD
jgi:hypothetical protein